MPSRICLCLLLAAGILPAQVDHKMTKADVDRWMTELSNWGKWGKDDQAGTLNLITPAKRKQALALVKEGLPISLAHDLDTERAEDNTNPFVHTVTARAGAFSLDTFTFNYHG
jgi:hypothetical protein